MFSICLPLKAEKIQFWKHLDFWALFLHWWTDYYFVQNVNLIKFQEFTKVYWVRLAFRFGTACVCCGDGLGIQVLIDGNQSQLYHWKYILSPQGGRESVCLIGWQRCFTAPCQSAQTDIYISWLEISCCSNDYQCVEQSRKM